MVSTSFYAQTLFENQMESAEKAIDGEYNAAVDGQLNRLAQIPGLQPPKKENIEKVSDYSDLLDWVETRLRWFTSTFELQFEDDAPGNITAYEIRSRVNDMEINPRGQTERYKRVEPNGTAILTSREIDYSISGTPEEYLSWLGAYATVAAKNLGTHSTLDATDDVVGYFWRNQLDETSTPMGARLHGTAWRGDPPFHPPVVSGGQSELLPVFDPESKHTEWNMDQEQAEVDRERWFRQYHSMRMGDIPYDGFTFSEPPESEKAIEFIYSEYLPRSPSEFVP